MRICLLDELSVDNYRECALSQRRMKLSRRRVEDRNSCVWKEVTEVMRNPNDGNNDSRFGVVLRDKGNEAMRIGQVQMAVEFYSQALRYEVTVPLLCHRADAYLKLDMYDDTVQDCSKVIRLQPKVWRAYALRGMALREQGNFAEAITDLRQAKKLCPKRAATHLEKLRMRCRREAESNKRARHLKALIQEGSRVPLRPFVKGDKRVTPAQSLLRMRDCLRVISRVLDEPGSAGAIIWKEDELDRWRRVRMRSNLATTKSKREEEEESVNYDTMVIVQRLEELQCCLREGGQEMRQMLGQCAAGFSTLLAVYGHQDLLLLEILHEALQDGDDMNVRAFLQAQPLPILAQSFQDPRQPLTNIACALLDLSASFKAQQILTFLMHENLIPVLLKSMHLGSITEHASSVSLFFKLALDPRLGRHLSRSLSSLQDLCAGLSRACGAGRQITRLQGAQAITALLEFENMRQSNDWEVSEADVPLGVSVEEPCDFTEPSLFSVFADGGVLRAVALLLARESERAPEKAETSSLWEEDVELICEEITTNVSDFSVVHECTLRDFNLLSGYAQILVLSAIRAMDFMADASRAVEILDQAHAWVLFIPLLSSFPHKLGALAAKTLAKFCRKSKTVAMHVAELWPVNSSLVVLELARSAHRSGDSQTYETAILILAELAGCKSFLASMQRPTSFNILIDFLQDGKSSTMTLKGLCTCLALAITDCTICVEFAEMKAYALGSRLLQLWCEYRAEAHLRWQVENLMFILMDKSFVLQHAILCLLENGNPSNYTGRSPGNDMAPYKQISCPTSPRDDDAAERYQSFSQNRMNFQKVCFFLSTLMHPSTKFADLCAGAGLMSIQVAKHFKEIQCYAVTRKRTWVEHTRRVAKHEAVPNLTAVLSKSFDHLPNTLPGSLDVAILCLSLDVIHDFGRLYCSVRAKLHQEGKLVLIDDNEELMIEARMQAASYGWNVVLQSTMAEQYLLLVLQRTNEL